MRTEWRATDDPRWPLTVLFYVVAAAAFIVLVVGVWHGPISSALAFPAASLLGMVSTTRARLRLTDEGVEVRKLWTRVYRWSDIVSVERAPEWEDSSVVWLRRRGAVPTSSPDVVAPPGLRGRSSDETLDGLVAVIRRRAGLDQSGSTATAPSEAPQGEGSV